MSLPNDCLQAVCLWLGCPLDLLHASLACRDWLETVKATDAWQRVFIWFWKSRQKPWFIRTLWKELVDEEVAFPPAISITASRSHFSRHQVHAEPDALATSFQNSSSSWYQKFICSAMDALVVRSPTQDELCFDTCFDPISGTQFPRCWLVSRNSYLPPEIQFHPGGLIIEHTYPLAGPIASGWTWKWISTDGSALELTRTSDSQVLVFRATRGRDAGFVFTGLNWVTISSRELTLEEHLSFRYRRDGREGRVIAPVIVVKVIYILASSSNSPNVRMPAELTTFERACMCALAELRGLRTSRFLHPSEPGVAIWLDPNRRDSNTGLSAIEQATNTGMAIEWSGISVSLVGWSPEKLVKEAFGGVLPIQMHQ